MSVRRVMVLVDPAHIQQAHPAIARATQLALADGAQLTLLAIAYRSELDSSHLFDLQDLHKLRESYLQQRTHELQGLAGEAIKLGVTVHCLCLWGRDWVSTLLEHLAEQPCDMLFKATHKTGAIKRWLFAGNDWQLIRRCPVPLWLVRDRPWAGKRLLAAVDPLHQQEDYAGLDRKILHWASHLNQHLALEEHYLHAFAPLPRSLVFDVEMVSDYDSYVRRCHLQHREAFEKVIAQRPVPLPQTHLIEGYAEDVLPDFVSQQHIDLLIMGAVARGQLDTALLGHTAERVLDKVDCELLILKPDHFKAPNAH
ncbi:universal stress protein [Atopomonas sediminilitoris]|uniref:universal stress protein n=1 Tax=Atopomonas sediminilitoris TaxID=2919919 RepID=UPI001F4E902C|nr:universal stress protein [Atopomonas sediminilitoris]MCJ8168687.1 universal stress protein [Atopomonas sediminilitoris]